MSEKETEHCSFWKTQLKEPLHPPKCQSGKTRLTYCRNHSDGEVKGSGEFPLHAGFVRFELQDDELQLLEVLFGQVVFAHEFVLPGVESPLVAFLLLGLQGLEDGRSDHQVGEDADDEGEGPGVLPLHDREVVEG